MTKKTDNFLEQTILTIFLWIGIWGIITMFFDQYVKGFGNKLAVYIFFAITSFYILKTRNHA